MSPAKAILALIVVGYLVSIYGFSYDPLGLVIKSGEKSAAYAQTSRSGPPRSRSETMTAARQFMKQGMQLSQIEERFGTEAIRIGQVYKTAILFGEQNYDQYQMYLGHGVTAYVLAETYARQIANNPNFLKFDAPH